MMLHNYVMCIFEVQVIGKNKDGIGNNAGINGSLPVLQKYLLVKLS